MLSLTYHPYLLLWYY